MNRRIAPPPGGSPLGVHITTMPQFCIEAIAARHGWPLRISRPNLERAAAASSQPAGTRKRAQALGSFDPVRYGTRPLTGPRCTPFVGCRASDRRSLIFLIIARVAELTDAPALFFSLAGPQPRSHESGASSL